MKEELVQAIANVKEQEALQLAQAMLDAGEDPQTVLDAGHQAMALVGAQYEKGKYFLPELIISGEILKQIADLCKPKLSAQEHKEKPLGKVVIGTVAGDIHDLGKDMVTFMLDVNRFEVYDLGVDVPAAAFVAKVKEVQPEIVAMSGFLTLAFGQMKATVEALQQAGLRNRIKVMIGGAPMNDTITQFIGADAYGRDAMAAVKLAKGWIGGAQS